MWWRVTPLCEQIARLEERLEAANDVNADLRARLEKSERAFERLRDQAMAQAGAIRTPLRDEAANRTKPLADTIPALVASLGVRSINSKKPAEEAIT